MSTQPLSKDISTPQPEVQTETKLPSMDMFGKVSSWFGSKDGDTASPVLDGAKSKVSSWFGSKDAKSTDETSSPVFDGEPAKPVLEEAKNKVSSWFGSKDAKSTDETPSPVLEGEPSKPVLEEAKNKVSSWFGSKNTSVEKATSPILEGEPVTPVLDGAKNKLSSWFGGKDTGALDAASPVLEGAKTKISSWFGSKDVEEAVADDQASPVMEGAKTIGNILYSAVNKAGQTVTEAGALIKKSVEENTILGEFNKEQESFIQEKNISQTKTSAALPPWVGHSNEDKLKAACLELSKDKKNFTRDPPPGVDFEFDYTTQYPVAMVTLENDKQLELMRFELVPAVLNEATFWRNYFYRVSLISQANELSSLEADHLSVSTVDTPEVPLASPQHTRTMPAPLTHTSDPHDFVSDTLDTDQQDLVEIREEMRKLGLSGTAEKSNTHSDGPASQRDAKQPHTDTTEEEWEKELEAEMNEFELVAKSESGADSPWDTQIESALDSIE